MKSFVPKGRVHHVEMMPLKSYEFSNSKKYPALEVIV